MKRTSAWTKSMWGTLFAVMLVSAAQAGKIQFGLAELPGTVDPHGDSYVVTIDETETELLAHARALVEWVATGGEPLMSPGETILVTEIVAGADHINRNYLATGQPAWSWHPVGTPSFADWTIEILDGWPTFVEADVDGWLDNTGGYVGFWGYTITTELGPLLPGDFDMDGDVDGTDFLNWQQGKSPNPLSESDLSTWRENYGTGSTHRPVARPLPEPGNSLFVTMLMVLFLLKHDWTPCRWRAPSMEPTKPIGPR